MRLFFGLMLPLPVRERLLAAMGGVENARWQDDAQLHVTLRFVGEVERPLAEDLAQAAMRFRGAPVEARVAGLGTFDRRGRIDNLHARIAPIAPLAALHRRLDRLCTGLGLEPERRAYVPHVTLARFGKAGAGHGLGAYLADHAALASAPFLFDRLALFESTLGRDGATYDPIVETALRHEL